MQQVVVALEERSYPIQIGAGTLQELASFLSPNQQTFIISDHQVAALYLEQAEALLGSACLGHFCFTAGEASKTIDTYAQALDAVMKSGLHRDGCIIALGGGVVGDLAGFVAATYQRGIDFIQVPTTLLAQVDSSVGGKTAVNHALGKNMIGAFYQPKAVLIDTQSLASLPDRDFIAGLAEVIKYGIMADADFFTWLEEHSTQLIGREEQALAYAIATSCEIKAKVVAADETEQGMRALLNLGHTFGHVIENELGYGAWLHGEAVAVGMLIASYLAQSCQTGHTLSDAERVKALLKAVGLPTHAPQLEWSVWEQGFTRDKKVQAGQVRFVLPMALGQAKVTHTPIDQAWIQAAIAKTYDTSGTR